jgi:hypothetical protein
LPGNGQGASDPPTISPDVIDSLETAIKTISSFDVTTKSIISHKIIHEKSKEEQDDRSRPKVVLRRPEPGENHQTHYHHRQILEGNSGHIDVIDTKSGKVTSSFAYTPDAERTFTPKAGAGSVQAPTVNLLSDGTDYRTAYRTLLGSVNLLKFLRQRTLTPVRAGEFPPHLIVVEAALGERKPEIDFPGWGARVAIDPTHGGLPAFVEVFDKDRGQERRRLRREIREWKALANGAFVPVVMVTEHYELDGARPFFGEAADQVELRVDVSRAQWNHKVAPADLTLAFPIGTRVFDRTRKISYVTGKADPGKHLDDLVDGALRVTPIRTDAPIPAPGWWQRYWVHFAAALALIGVATIVRVRKRRAHA